MADERWQELKRRLTEAVSDYVGRVEYGNLRMEIYEADSAVSDAEAARAALAFEIPGGSTSQFAVSYEHGAFHMLDANAEDVLALDAPAAVVDAVRAQIAEIPAYRVKRLRDDIDLWLAQDGFTRQAAFEELNRLLRLGHEFRGGSLTVDELTAACRYVVGRFEARETPA
jgi:hypothetical protein